MGTEVGIFRSTKPIDCRGAHCDPKFVKVTDMYGRGLYRDRDGTTWIAANLDGLVAFRGGRMTKYTTKDGLPNNVVRGMQQDRDGSLWLGTRGGGLANLKDGKFTVYTDKDGLAAPFVVSLFMDRDNTLWIGTRDGLNRLKAGKFTTYTPKDGLFAQIRLQHH